MALPQKEVLGLLKIGVEMENLGYANGWSDTPEIVRECRGKGHVCASKNIGRCLTEYSCSICGYKYKVDSGG